MDEVSGRENSPPFHKLRLGGDDGKTPGILLNQGEEWKEQRRFSLKTLRDLGLGRSTMEDAINMEVDKLTDMLKENYTGEPVDLQAKLNVSIVNALWFLLVGENFSLEDPRLHHIVNLINDTVRVRRFSLDTKCCGDKSTDQ